MILDKSLSKILKIVPIGLFLYCSMSAMSTCYSTTVSWILCLGLMLIVLFYNRKVSVDLSMKNPANILFVFLLGTICFYCIIYFSLSELNSTVTLVLTLVTAFFITKAISFDNFIEIYIKILRLLAIVALVIYFTVFVLDIFLLYSKLINVNNVSYYNWWICVLMSSQAGEPLQRMMSIFWEPGVFASFLIVALVFEMKFVKRKINVITIFIFCICIFFTYSTAGYILLMATIFYLLFRIKNKTINKIVTFISVILFILVILKYDEMVEFLANWNYDIFYKLVDDSGSFTTRVFAYRIEWEIVKSSNYLGAGLSRASKMFTMLQDIYKNIDARTSTSLMYTSAYGLAGLMYSVAWIYGCMKKMSGSIVEKILFSIIMICIINKEPHIYSLATNCILFYLLDQNKYSKEVSI